MSKLKTLKDIPLQFTSTRRITKDAGLEMVSTVVTESLRKAAQEYIKIWENSYKRNCDRGNPKQDAIDFIKIFFNLEDD